MRMSEKYKQELPAPSPYQGEGWGEVAGQQH